MNFQSQTIPSRVCASVVILALLAATGVSTVRVMEAGRIFHFMQPLINHDSFLAAQSEQGTVNPDTSPARRIAKQSTSSLPATGIEPSSTVPPDFTPSPQVEFYGNYETAGVIAALPEGVPAGKISEMRCFMNIDGQWSPMHDLTQVGEFPWFATSLFWLKPGCKYQVKVEVIDTNRNRIATWYSEGLTRADPVLHDSARTLFVSPDGDDANSGTPEKPFSTLSHAFALVQAGETVSIRGGTYHEGQLQFANNGQAGRPIVVRAHPGEKVILDGTDTSLTDGANWTQVGERIYSHPYTEVTANACVEEMATGRMIRLFPVPSLDELKTRTLIDKSECQQSGPFEKMGIEGAVHTDGTTVTLALPLPIDRFRVRLPRQRLAIELSRKSHIQIDGLQFNHYGKREQSAAVLVMNSSDILIQNCGMNYDDCFVYVKGQSDRLTIQDCQFRDAILDWPFGYMKCGSGVSGFFEGGAVNVDARYSGRGLVFRRNSIAGVFDGAHLCPWKVDEARTQETDFYQNYIDGCLDDFIETDGFSRNTRIFDNVMNRSLSGISVAQALDGPTFALYNVIGNCGMVSASQREGNSGYPFKTNGGSGEEIGSGPMFLYHNTAYTNDPHSRALLVKRPKWKSLVLRNNIWCGKKMGFELWNATPSPIDWDFDDLFISDPGEPLVVQAYRTKYQKLDDVRSRLKWLVHGISEEPKFIDPENADYRLQKDSPCIDAGVALPGINDRRTTGTAPDLGAFEKR